MDFRVGRDIIAALETVYDGLQEQSVELDYMLPDYCAEIFKIIKCKVTPRIVSRFISGDRATYDLTVTVNVIYLSENSNALHCVKQKLNYTKSIEFGRSFDNVSISLRPKTDYINCRAVNPRRIDIRGAVSIKVKAFADRKQEVITDAEGLAIELRKRGLQYCAKKLYGEKQNIWTEEMELSPAKPPIHSIINTNASIMAGDNKVIAGKIITKGELTIKTLYTCEQDGVPALDITELSVPYNAIIDLDGVDDSYNVSVIPTLAALESTATGGSDGAFKRIQYEITIGFAVKATKSSEATIVTDAYSRLHPCQYGSSKIRLDSEPTIINEIFPVKPAIDFPDSNIASVLDVWADVVNVSCTACDGGFNIAGAVNHTVIAVTGSGAPAIFDCSTPFEYSVSANLSESSIIDIDVFCAGSSFTLGGNSVTVKSDMAAFGTITAASDYDAVTDLDVDETAQKSRDGDYALKLYYGTEGEDLWEIAKKYSTGVECIAEENNLSGDILENNNMILIPILA